ncbi:Hypothetical protein SMAX5B_014291 [Scophthalmus maximus]|uniref:Uncharacterized protein n=1 Tax=Scophthalmus maximus TaxID=52904 RepID=A0A2U9BGV2_SCOMX|nr:Hypothetical protein SMAX5B_014291 [Scophthalmus maximus]
MAPLAFYGILLCYVWGLPFFPGHEGEHADSLHAQVEKVTRHTVQRIRVQQVIEEAANTPRPGISR